MKIWSFSSNIEEIIKKSADELTLDEIQVLLDLANSVYSEVPEQYHYDNIVKRILSNIPDSMDKRTGSIIFDAIAPCSAELANMYIEIQIFKDQTYVKTAKGQNLDKIGEQYSIPRLVATKSQRIAEFIDSNDNLVNIPVGNRFSVPSSNATITYKIIQQTTTGHAIIECEQYGTIGNEYSGALLPLFTSNNLKSATIIGTQQPARNDETDDEYSIRIINKLNYKSFGGNIRQYKDYVESISGTSEPKVFPVWNGGGTVKLSILDSQYNAISNEFIAEIKELIDPEEYTGQGVGLAPIGHVVTVVTPTEYVINITGDIVLEDGVTIGSVQSNIEENIENYLYGLRKNWVDDNTTYIYINRIISAILDVEGVINVDNVEINDSSDNVELTQDKNNQYIPVLGTVVLSE